MELKFEFSHKIQKSNKMINEITPNSFFDLGNTRISRSMGITSSRWRCIKQLINNQLIHTAIDCAEIRFYYDLALNQSNVFGLGQTSSYRRKTVVAQRLLCV